MTRPSLTTTWVLAAGLLGGAGCLPPDGGMTTHGDGEPSVGRLQFKDRIVNLTPDVFADERYGVPRDATANVMADIALDARQTGAAIESEPPRP